MHSISECTQRDPWPYLFPNPISVSRSPAARRHLRPPRTTQSAALTEWDFLLGVHDETQMGAIRFQDMGVPHSGK